MHRNGVNQEIRVLLVDDHALVRETLSSRLDSEPDIRIVGQVDRADDVDRLVDEEHPDVVLMDIDMPGMNSFDAARRIAERGSQAKVLFLSAFFHDRYIEQALAVRAFGYLTKSERPQNVIAAVREVAHGNTYFSHEVRERLVVDQGHVRLAETTRPGEAARTRASTMTPRELEVLRYIARGLSKKEMATVMKISVKTVENHSGSLMKKLDIHDRVELARFAIREGLAEA